MTIASGALLSRSSLSNSRRCVGSTFQRIGRYGHPPTTSTAATAAAAATTSLSWNTGSAGWFSSTTMVQTTGLPGDRLPLLRQLLEERRLSGSDDRPVAILETHSGLSGLIAEHTCGKSGRQFDGMWSSSLTASASQGMPDIEAVDTSARLALVQETLNVTTKPMIYDGDTGGLPEIFKFTVKSLEQMGVSAVIIEDKEGLKQNSLLANSNDLHQLSAIEDFCEKIRVGVAAKRTKDFMIIGRMESLVAGRSMEEALQRALASVEAGANGIMIHSRKKAPDEILEFLTLFRQHHGREIPVVVVPSSFNTVTEQELGLAGASIVIYANQLLRASFPAMQNVAELLLDHGRAFEADPHLMKIAQITKLIDHDGAAQITKKDDTTETEKKKTFSSGGGNAAMKKTVTAGNHSTTLRSPKGDTGVASFSSEAAQVLEDSDNDESQVCPTGLVDFLTDSLGINFFTGVPDSCIKKFCSQVDLSCRESQSNQKKLTHAVTANEGSSIALAVGNYLATQKVPLVYMQNSGLGNAANPLLSAAHPNVYGIPMMMVIGWRGAPGTRDEPQHVVTGLKCKEILQSLDVPTFVLPTDQEAAEMTMRSAHDNAVAHSCPVAILVEPDTFSGTMAPTTKKSVTTNRMSREEALTQLLNSMHPSDAVVATTGFTSRELYELREARGEQHATDFLCVGSMGHALAIAQGIALSQPQRTVWCLDGDGAALMHMGSMAFSGPFGLSNLRHVLINNEVHESVGGQDTVATQGDGPSLVDFQRVASSVGYVSMNTATSKEELNGKLATLSNGFSNKPAFLEIKVATGTRPGLGRPKTSTAQAKTNFMNFLQTRSDREDFKPKAVTSTGDSFLLTPGPLTTSKTVKEAMLHDFGSRDSAFVELTAKVRSQLLEVLGGPRNDQLTSVLLQGSGTFSVEAMITQFVPTTGKLLILANGAYGKRMAQICKATGRPFELVESPEDQSLDVDQVAKIVEHSDATHVAVIACETTTGVLNPVSEIASIVSSSGKGFLVDAMSSFGVIDIDSRMKFDAIAASSNKGLQGSPGIGFVIANKKALEESNTNSSSLSLDLYQQWRGFEASGQWRFTPPTHCLLAMSQALDEFQAEGGVAGRHARYKANSEILIGGMRALGFETIISDDTQAPVIVTFRMPSDPSFDFNKFYNCMSEKGYVIYPGKLTTEPTFRVGCIGNVFPEEMEGFIVAVDRFLKDSAN